MNSPRLSFTASGLDPAACLLLPADHCPAESLENALRWQADLVETFAFQPRFGLFLQADTYRPEDLEKLFQSLACSSYPHFLIALAASQATAERVRQSAAWPCLEARTVRLSPGDDLPPVLDRADWWAPLTHGTRPQPASLFAVAKLMQGREVSLLSAHAHLTGPAGQRALLRLPDSSPFSCLGRNIYGTAPLIPRSFFRPNLSGEIHPWTLGLAAENAGASRSLVPLLLWTADHAINRPPGEDSLQPLLVERARQLQAGVQRWQFLPESGYPVPEPIPVAGSLGIVIPFRDQPALTSQTLRSLAGQTGLGRRQIILLDNGSSPSAMATVRQTARELYHPDEVTHLPCPGPFNFAALNNAGVAALDTDFVLFLNNDIEFTAPDDLARLLGLAAWPGVGLVGPQLVYPDGTRQAAGMKFGPAGPQVIRQDWEYPGTFAQVDGLTFAVALGRRQTFIETGGLDERLCPNGFGDALFARRLQDNGLAILVHPLVSIIHHESKSRGSRPEEIEHWELWSAGLHSPARFDDFARGHRQEILPVNGTRPKPPWHKRLYRAGRAAWKIWRHPA